MASITYLTGDATAPKLRPAVIAHVCNDIGGWGAGFVLAISKRWKAPEADYRAWYKSGKDFALGRTRLVMVDDDLWVANMIAQHGIRRRAGVPPIRYDALREALSELHAQAPREASVHMPRIGCGLAGGTWDEVGPIVEETLVAQGRDVVVYDFGGA
ncbi:MAG: macro domain-containing protein [Rhodobacteraceae bacterium]|nr:macro domain-containing protein [Alphaproteobacteria bacterium]MBT8475636.1 macro domain-containing protein [Alphaproteobacteria bacterium]NNK67279.1 macro domain-containing protein [Paracoccaceae bacterium]